MKGEFLGAMVIPTGVPLPRVQPGRYEPADDAKRWLTYGFHLLSCTPTALKWRIDDVSRERAGAGAP